jgi:hypothetical protein
VEGRSSQPVPRAVVHSEDQVLLRESPDLDMSHRATRGKGTSIPAFLNFRNAEKHFRMLKNGEKISPSTVCRTC